MKKAQPEVQQVKRNASFVCKRAEFLNALKAIKGARNQHFTITTVFAEQKLIIKTDFFELSIPCSECTGNDVSFKLQLASMKQYCKLVLDESYRFTIDDNSLQLNTTFLRI